MSKAHTSPSEVITSSLLLHPQLAQIREILDNEVMSVLEELKHTNRRLEENEVFQDGVTISYNRLKALRAKALAAIDGPNPVAVVEVGVSRYAHGSIGASTDNKSKERGILVVLPKEDSNE